MKTHRLGSLAYGSVMVLLLMVMLAACAQQPVAPPQVTSHVVRFPDFATPPAGQRFIVLPLADQAQSAEFNQYRREIEQRLMGQGMIGVADQADADLLVTLSYAIGVHIETEVIEEYGLLSYGQTFSSTDVRYNVVTGFYESYPTTEYIPPVHGVTGYHTETNSIYDRSLALRIFDLERSSGDDLYPAYEGTVQSSGATPSFAGVSACLFDALFQNFLTPGTQDVAILASSCVR
ncbi:MAG: hypothetical protein P8Q36_19600 [Alphaproteobacteria bacterium]|nr:hypothetical protein [Rhodospirillaceae bacterium]MBT6204572.1 hypothetical protein [Rhodospirillaceae bacterium]MBT6510464.1 hypothetical protein [Rhodospirillaceae bacterium]MBT7613034.1 hypothetical protein [Rhodospirillaceae bacterium]MDG2483046.1 hypothetical protein [Alphaproteobacteria bacterium]